MREVAVTEVPANPTKKAVGKFLELLNAGIAYAGQFGKVVEQAEPLLHQEGRDGLVEKSKKERAT